MTAGSCKVHLKDDARRRASEALFPIPAMPYPKSNTDVFQYTEDTRRHAEKYADELHARREFTGPHFKDCVVQVDFLTPGWVHVELEGDTMYSYPAADVARVKVYHS